MKKTALYSPVLPPSGSGQALVLFNLLKKEDPKKFLLLSGIDYSEYPVIANVSKKLDCEYEKIHVSLLDWPFGRLKKVLFYLDSKFDFFFFFKVYSPICSYKYLSLIEKRKINQFICCSGNLFEPYAIYLACKKRKIPYFFYAFDCFSLQWLEKSLKKFAEKVEPIIINGSKNVFVPNELLRDYYNNLYGVDCDVIHNAIDIQSNIETEKDPSQDSKKEIIYTGSIYYVHIDSFINLINAIKIIDDGITLSLYSAQDKADLAEKGILGPVNYNPEVPYRDSMNIQRGADILFLPLGFNSENPELIKLSAPGKMGEYLASGRPLLVHAPENSFVSCYFRKYNCGVVVSEPDPNKLSEAIKKILTDEKFSDIIIKNAINRAKIDFDIRSNREKFFKVLFGN